MRLSRPISEIELDDQFLEAIRRGYFEQALSLLSDGADINAQNSSGTTALHDIVWAGVDSMAEELIKRGARIDLENKSGETALHIAARQGATEIMKVMLAKDPDLTAETNQGNTPLLCAATAMDGGCVRAAAPTGSGMRLAVGKG